MHLLSRENPKKMAIRLGDEAFSFQQIQSELLTMAAQLNKLPEGILLLEAQTNFSFIIQFLAALYLKKPIALCSKQEPMQKLLGTRMRVDAQGQLLELEEKKNTPPYHPQLALILFTSGSTGQAKAVQLSQNNILANCHSVIKALEFSSLEDQLLFLPLSYSFGLLGQLLPGLMSGMSTNLIPQFTDIKALLEQGQVPAMWSGVPSHWVALTKMAALYPESATQITSVISAGAPLTLSVRANLRKAFPNAVIYNNYGLTEASPRVLTYSSKDPLFWEDYAGYPVGDWQVTLSKEGELLIKGSQLMLGYLFEEHPSGIQEEWFHTGDLAEITPEGLIAIKGRRDRLVNIGGEKINLIEVEQKLCQIEGIKEVILLPLNDELYGVRLLAYLEHNSFTATKTEKQLTQTLQTHFLPKKLPISVRLIKQLPRHPNGKLDPQTLVKEEAHAY